MDLHSRSNEVRKVKFLQYQRVKTHATFGVLEKKIRHLGFWKRKYGICKTMFPREDLILRGLLLHVEVAIRDCSLSGNPEFRERCMKGSKTTFAP